MEYLYLMQMTSPQKSKQNIQVSLQTMQNLLLAYAAKAAGKITVAWFSYWIPKSNQPHKPPNCILLYSFFFLFFLFNRVITPDTDYTTTLEMGLHLFFKYDSMNQATTLLFNRVSAAGRIQPYFSECCQLLESAFPPQGSFILGLRSHAATS